MKYQMIHEFSKIEAIKIDLYDIQDVLAHDRSIPKQVHEKLKNEINEIYDYLNSYGGDENIDEVWNLYNEVNDALEHQDTF